MNYFYVTYEFFLKLFEEKKIFIIYFQYVFLYKIVNHSYTNHAYNALTTISLSEEY